MNAVLPCAYFPNLSWWTAFLSSREVLLEAHENYVKQSYRSRCYILGPNQVQPLKIHVDQSGSKKPFKDVKINYTEDWCSHQWRSIQTAYGKAPYFDHYRSYFEEFFRTKREYLFDLNLDGLTLCLQLMQLDTSIGFTQNYQANYDAPSFLDLRYLLDAKNPSRYPDFFIPRNYTQLFGKFFVPNLSIIDLLMCEGPASVVLLTSCYKGP